MKKVVVLTILISLLTGSVWNDTGAYELFVNTDPIGAEVSIGDEQVGKTPLRIQNFDKDSIFINITKHGFVPISRDEQKAADRRSLIFYTLSTINLRLRFDQREKDVFINEVNAGKTPIIINNLPSGTYQFENSERGISLSTTGYRSLKRTALLETLFSSAFLGSSIAGYYLFSGMNREKEAEFLGISSAFFGGLLVYNLLKVSKLQAMFKKDVKDLSIIEVEPVAGEGPLDFFSSGMELLGREEWQAALRKFLYIEHVYPDSQVTPLSIYEAGYSYYRMGNLPSAVEYFKRSVHEYPIYELFPYAVFYLLEAEIAQGNVQNALGEYESVRPVYLEDESGDLIKDYYRVLLTVYQETGGSDRSILVELLDELDYFLAAHPDALGYPEIYLLKGELLYQYLDREGGRAILEDIGQKYRHDAKLLSELDRVLYGR